MYPIGHRQIYPRASLELEKQMPPFIHGGVGNKQGGTMDKKLIMIVSIQATLSYCHS